MHHKLNPISKNKVKFILSLRHKKQRYKNEQFIVEGDKFVQDLIKTAPSRIITIIKKEGYSFLGDLPPSIELFEADTDEFNKISSVKNPQNLLAVVTMSPDELSQNEKLWVILDRLQDPGNIGTIIRSCAWYGIYDIICLKGTADPFEMKSVQASAGMVVHMRLHFSEIDELEELIKNRETYILDMIGTPIYDSEFSFKNPNRSCIIVGNEGQGIDDQLLTLKNQLITIPSLSDTEVESLNAAISLSTALYEWSRT